MEVERERSESTKKEAFKANEIPSAPEFDQESLSNVIEDNYELPERIERAQTPSIWSRIKRSFSKYKPMNEEQFHPNVQSSNQINSNFNNNNSNAVYDTVFGDLKKRNQFLRKILALFVGQLSFFTALAGLFYYIPHLRHIFRIFFADKIFLKMSFGLPIGAFLLILFLFESIRRRYQKIVFLALTLCLRYYLNLITIKNDFYLFFFCLSFYSSLLCYVMSHEKDNLLIFSEMALTNGCFFSAGLLNFVIPRFSLRNRFETLYFPVTMLAGQSLQPFLMNQSLSSTWYKNLAFVAGTSYLGFNMNSVMNNEKLALKPNESMFGLIQSYININPTQLAFSLFSSPSSSFERIA